MQHEHKCINCKSNTINVVRLACLGYQRVRGGWSNENVFKAYHFVLITS